VTWIARIAAETSFLWLATPPASRSSAAVSAGGTCSVGARAASVALKATRTGGGTVPGRMPIGAGAVSLGRRGGISGMIGIGIVASPSGSSSGVASANAGRISISADGASSTTSAGAGSSMAGAGSSRSIAGGSGGRTLSGSSIGSDSASSTSSWGAASATGAAASATGSSITGVATGAGAGAPAAMADSRGNRPSVPPRY
jgi:hypothetical protein